MQVLVLEDSGIMRKVLVKQLLAMGLQESEIQEAHNGADALRKINSTKFDLLLLDIVMDGIDGVAVLKEAKKLMPDAKVVMCSTFSEKQMVKDLIDIGIDDFVVKPFAEGKLREALQRNLSGVVGS